MEDTANMHPPRRLQLMTVSSVRAKGYEERVVDGHGRCLVVPAAEFQDAWRLELAKTGHACVDFTLDGEAVVFVKLTVDPVVMQQASVMRVARPVPAVVLSHVEEVKGVRKHPIELWPQERVDKLKALWNDGKTYAAITKALVSEFPDLQNKDVNTKIKYLLRHGEIAGRRINDEKAEGTTEIDKSSNSKSFVGLTVKVPPKYASFDSLWATVNSLDTDLRQRAGNFYNAAVEAGLPGAIIDSVLECLQEIDASSKMRDSQITDLQKRFGELNNSLQALRKQLKVHKHAVGSGEAMLPMEVPE